MEVRWVVGIVLGCLILGAISLFLFFPKEDVERAKELCIKICEKSRNVLDLSNGPCLSDNNPEWNIEDWVCDVAHWPRESVDNRPENQCSAYRHGLAHHFVEVTPECEFIRAV